MTRDDPRALSDAGVNRDQAFRQYEADLAQQLKRVCLAGVDVADEDVGEKSAQLGHVEPGQSRQGQLSGRFEDGAEHRHRRLVYAGQTTNPGHTGKTLSTVPRIAAGTSTAVSLAPCSRNVYRENDGSNGSEEGQGEREILDHSSELIKT